MASLVLGVIALLLFFMPILGIPLSVCGMFFGIVGLFASFTASRTNLRASIAGLAASSLALAINVAIANAPAGYLHDPTVPRLWQPVPDRPHAPPPASQK
jgi:hypothetical protein